MAKVLSLVNSISSTSIPVEIADAVNRRTNSQVTVGSIMQTPTTDLDPDIDSNSLPIEFFSGLSNYDYQAYKRLAMHIRSNKYDIIHTHHNFSGSICRIVSQLENTPVISTEHNDLRYFTIPQRVANLATYKLSDVNVYNSNSTMSSRNLVEKYLSERDEVIYNGINIERINESKGDDLPIKLPDGLLITNVGVMTEQKNQKNILRAAQQVKQRSTVENIHFVIASSGPLESELKSLASQLGLSDLVTFTGYLPEREQIYSLLHQSDVFLTPSVYEGFCVAAVEAMGCGLPVVASDIDVFREVVGKHGIFVPHDDPDVIATQLIKLISKINSKQIQKKRKKLRQRAVSKYSLKQTAIEYHELYHEVSTNT